MFTCSDFCVLKIWTCFFLNLHDAHPQAHQICSHQIIIYTCNIMFKNFFFNVFCEITWHNSVCIRLCIHLLSMHRLRFAERNSSNVYPSNWGRHGGPPSESPRFKGVYHLLLNPAGAKWWWLDHGSKCSGCRVGDRASDCWRKPYQGAVDLGSLNLWQIWQMCLMAGRESEVVRDWSLTADGHDLSGCCFIV